MVVIYCMFIFKFIFELYIRKYKLKMQDKNKSPNKFNITDYGAVGDGKTDNTAVFNSVIQKISQTANPVLVIPAGNFLIKTILFQDLKNFTLQFKKKSVLIAPSNPADWNWSGSNKLGLLVFLNCVNLNINGKGLINGQGSLWWKTPDADRPQLIVINKCNTVTFSGVSLVDSPFYNIRIFDSLNLIFHDFSITATGPNTDGINIEQGVDNLEAYNLTIANGDDAFAVNSFQTPSSNISFHDSIINSGHGVSIGSGIYQAISKVKFDNLKINNADYGLRIKCKNPSKNNNSTLTDVTYSNITMTNISQNPILIKSNYHNDEMNKVITFNNITYSNIKSNNSGYGASFIFYKKSSIPSPIVISNVFLENIRNSNPNQNQNKVENANLQVDKNSSGYPFSSTR